MEIYDLDTVFTFGKFEGKMLKEVIDLEPAYIDWCIVNLPNFYIPDDEIEAIKAIKPGFALSEEGLIQLFYKYQSWENENEECDGYDETTEDYEEDWSDDELEMADWEYDPMNPAHDRNENPWIDVFGLGEEAETAYWNTD